MAIAKLVAGRSDAAGEHRPETGQTIIAGMGELHLEIIVDRMQREFSVGANVGKPQVAYRETIRKAPKAKAGSCARRAAAASTATSRSASSRSLRQGLRVCQRDRRRHVPKEFINPADKGMEEALEGGVLAGFPMSNVKVTLYDGSYHDVDSSKWRSRSPVRWPSRMRRTRPSRSCSSR